YRGGVMNTSVDPPAKTPSAPRTATTAPDAKPESRAERAMEFGLRFVMVWVMIALAIAADILYPGFFDWGNISNILSQNAPVGLIAIAMTFVIIAGGLDQWSYRHAPAPQPLHRHPRDRIPVRRLNGAVLPQQPRQRQQSPLLFS